MGCVYFKQDYGEFLFKKNKISQTYEQIKWGFFHQSMNEKLVILGLPPGGLCLKSKVGQRENLPWCFADEELSIVTMVTPLFLLFFLCNKMQEPTPSTIQDKNWHGKDLLGILTYLRNTCSLHSWAKKLKCVEFKSPIVVVPSLRHIKVL